MKTEPKVFVIGSGVAEAQDLETEALAFQAKPSFRKASVNMKLAFIAANRAILESKISATDLNAAGFVLGSSYGELIQTKEFLKAWAKEGLARPLLFQSSLHNGTLGFLSLEYGLKGPSFTVSHHCLTSEKSLELGMDLIRDEACDLVLISAVEVMDPDLLPSLKHRMPKEVFWSDSAASVILASENFVIQNKIPNARELLKVEYSKSGEAFKGHYNDSDGLEKWIHEMRKPISGHHQVRLLKRDGQETLVEWREP